MIAFQRTLNGNTNIYRIDAATPESDPGMPDPNRNGQVVQVTNGGSDTAPAWAPDPPTGDPVIAYPPIAFERAVNGHRDIFVANYDGTDTTNLTNSTGADYANPSWSPVGAPVGAGDGLRLAFDSTVTGDQEIWVMDIGYDATKNQFVGSNMREVTAGQPASSEPNWFTFDSSLGPDSLALDAIAFAGPDQDGGSSQINVAEDTTGRDPLTPPFADPIDFAALTNDPANNTAPSWSPLGDLIAYQKTAADGNADIYVLNPTADDATGDVNLTLHVGDNRNPDWEAPNFLSVASFPIRPLGRRRRRRMPQVTRDFASRHTLTASVTGSGAGVVAGPGISCPPSCSQTYDYATPVTLRAVAAPGSRFDGWTGPCSGIGACNLSMTAEVQVKATFDMAPPPLVPPVLSALSVSPHKFAVTGRLRHGRCVALTRRNRRQRVCVRPIALRVHYKLNVAARLTVTIDRELLGRLVRGRCLAVTKTNTRQRQCTRLVPVSGSLIWNGTAGPGTLTFDGRIGGRMIKPGSYRLTVTPNAGGHAGKVEATTFRILP